MIVVEKILESGGRPDPDSGDSKVEGKLRPNLQLTIIEQASELLDLRSRLSEVEAECDAMRCSTSWRLTAPLRFAGHQVKRILHLWRLLPRTITCGGGWSGTARKALKVVVGEGIPGVKERLRKLQLPDNRMFSGAPKNRCDYEEWVRRYDTMTDQFRARLVGRLSSLQRRPLLSLVMPVYNPRLEWLAEAIESVRRQLYSDWELCIADDCSTDPGVLALLRHYAVEDSRIKVVFRESNGHISAASNSALELVTGEFIGLFDHDDVLAEHALLWVADAINKNPRASLIYSDEDKLDTSGKRFDPYFKCEWNPDLFYSQNIVCHLGVYRTELVREVGGFRLGFEGAQDYDLALRCVERISPRDIVHIPRILYHWRRHDDSTANALDAKPYAVQAGENALNDHLLRRGGKARVDATESGMYRIRYALPSSLPQVTLIIPTRNGLHLLQRAVESVVSKTTYPNYEILIIDNGSDDPRMLEYFRSFSEPGMVRVVRDDRPFNYSALNNSAVETAEGELVGLLNNDIEVINPDWLTEMVSLALQPDIGAVGARLWYPDDTLQHGGVIIGVGGVAGHSHKRLARGLPGYFQRANVIQSLSAVTAACLVIRKSTFLQVGGLNEVDLPVAFNDVDFCLRVRDAGFRNVWTPYAELYHHESATRGPEETEEKRARAAREVRYMLDTWGESLMNDPAYSPNLSLKMENFSFAWPPRIDCLTYEFD